MSIPPAPPDAPARLSLNQAQLWYLDEFLRGTSTYTINHQYRLRGALDIRALEAALTTIVRRHESLRTTFSSVGGEPRSVVHPPQPVQLDVNDLTTLPAGARAGAAHQRMQQLAHEPLDLAHGPLARFRLIRLANDEHLFLVQMHHIISDGWSIGVFARELSAFYASERTGLPPPPPEPATRYRDFVEWQGRRLTDGTAEKSLVYWENNLRDAPLLLEIPSDRPHPGTLVARGAEVRASIDGTLRQALQQIAAGEKSSLFPVLLSAFQVLLHRLSGQDDIVVGAPFAARSHSKLENLIGYFVNVLPLRTRLSGAPSFIEVVRQARETTFNAFTHQDVPFNLMVERVKPGRVTGRNPIFQVLFVFQSGLTDVPELEHVTVESLPSGVQSAKFDLTLYVTEHGRGLDFNLEYNAEMFEATTAARLLARFETLLRSIAAQPAAAIDRLPVLPAEERTLLLQTWNSSVLHHPTDLGARELFAAQVARHPDHVALTAGTTTLTYAELDARATQLARHLRDLGVTSEQLVGVCLDRNADLVVALLAVHKAGGAYLPLDPAYPRDRLHYVLQDARATVLLTHERWRDLFAAATSSTETRHIVCLDTDAPVIAGASSAPLATATSPGLLSHVIYTSGSTGNPKGVALEQRNLTAFLHWARAAYSDEELAGVLAATSVCFDLSVFEIFVPLCWGGTVHLVDNALALPDLPPDRRITLLNTVPSAIAALLRADALPESIQVVNLAGEPLAAEIVDQLYVRAHIRKVYDLYGPTEDTVYSTCALRQPRQPATIGRPLPNKQLYLLDGHLVPVPVGTVGEIFIGGTGVARGYLNRPDRTAARFLPDPFRRAPGALLYRTGDLARFRSDGQIEFLGRGDHQIKVRGFRIELGEIEAVLRRHAAVRDTVAVAHDAGAEDRRITAYVVFHDGGAVDFATLRRHLRTHLPEYMVPATFVSLPQLPLTPNGKVDRKALPPPDRDAPATGQVLVEPRSERERELAEIWRRLLARDHVGVHDNFFTLGGHSLLAMRLIHEIKKCSGQTLPLATLFATPTIAELATRLDAPAAHAAASTPVHALRGTGTGAPLFFIPGLGGFEFAPPALAQAIAGAFPFCDALQFPGVDGSTTPLESVEEIARNIVGQIRRIRPQGPYNICGFCFGGVVAFEVARQLRAEGASVPALVIWHGYPMGTWPTRSLGAALREFATRFLHGSMRQRWRMIVDKAWFLAVTAHRRGTELAYRAIGRTDLHYIAGVDFLPPDVDRRVVAANLRAHKNFRPQPYDGRTFLLLGATDRLRHVCPPRAGWDGVLIGTLEMFKLPIEHLELLKDTHISHVAAQTLSCLQAASGTNPAASTSGFVAVPHAGDPVG